MKKLLSAFLLTSIFSFSASAFYVQGQVRCNAGYSCSGYVYNNFGRPIYCEGELSAMTAMGFYLNAYVSGEVYPGMSISGYVYANNPAYDPIINANISFNCEWLM